MELEIETMPATLERFGLTLAGLFATSSGRDDDGEYSVSVSGEIIAKQDTEWEDIPTLVAAIYDAGGRVVGTAEHYLSDFAGFDTFDLVDFVSVEPVRVRFFTRG